MRIFRNTLFIEFIEIERKYTMSHLTNLQSRMKAGEVEAVLVSSEINQRYLTGLNYTDGYVLVLPEAAYLLADFRYIEVARATAGSVGTP